MKHATGSRPTPSELTTAKPRPKIPGKYLISACCVLLIAALAGILTLFSPDAVSGRFNSGQINGGLSISCPAAGAIFPPEIAPTAFRWVFDGPAPARWLVSIRFGGGKQAVNAFVKTSSWTPSPGTWKIIRKFSSSDTANLTVVGFGRGLLRPVLCGGISSFTTSEDSVKNPLFYREVILPFSEAVKDPSRIRWRFGTIDAQEPPRIVLENLPVCGNCHSFSLDGKTIGMDVDYANDKGSYAFSRVAHEINLATSDILTWSDFRREDGVATFGLLSQVSPDGRYVVSTVKDRSVFVPKPDLFFSQLFFPFQGILGFYSKDTRKFGPLPGADDPKLVQSNASWSPDGKTIVFARSKVYRPINLKNSHKVLLSPDECREFLTNQKLFKYDLYRLPFNGGNGGTAEPLPGASGNGMSNFFARYSPDGKWIVFCQAASFMLLQPDSKLYIMPAAGGTPRLMRCNTNRMNSWHTWSSNSRWLVFSSKQNSAFTRLFITHIDENGNDAPAIPLENLTAPDRAANIPEFVYAAPDAIVKINEKFIDDVSLWRAGKAFEEAGDITRAREKYIKALEINPDNVKALASLGIAFSGLDKYDMALELFTRAISLDSLDPVPYIAAGNVYYAKNDFRTAVHFYTRALILRKSDVETEVNIGRTFLKLEDYRSAMVHYEAAERLLPDFAPALCGFGRACTGLCRFGEAIEKLSRAVELDPENVDYCYFLAAARLAEKDTAAAIDVYRNGLVRIPGDAELSFYLANLVRSRDRAGAERLYWQAISGRPGFRDAQDSLASLQKK